MYQDNTVYVERSGFPRCGAQRSATRSPTKSNKTAFVVQYKFCTKKGFCSFLSFSAPPPPAPPRGLWGLCARPGSCLALGAFRVPPRSGRCAVFAGGGGSASAGPWLSVVAPPARRPSRAPAPRRWAGSLALPSARFGLPCGRPPSAPGAARPRRGGGRAGGRDALPGVFSRSAAPARRRPPLKLPV